MASRRGSMDLEWKELFGLIIGGILLVSVFSPLLGYIDNIIGVTSPTQKSFNSLCGEVDELISSPERMDHADHVAFTLEGERALFGFDANYTQTRAFVGTHVALDGMDSYIDSAAEKGADRAVGNISAPDICMHDKACLCLADISDFNEENTLEWLDCRSFSENTSLFGIPFYDEGVQERKGERNPRLDEIKSLYEEASAWDPRNFGLIRQDKNTAYRERLAKRGFNKSWYDWYGYLYIPPAQYSEDASVSEESGSVRSVSIEKLETGDHTYLLFIPIYRQLSSDRNVSVSSEVVSHRRELFEEQQKQRERYLRDRINTSHNKLEKDPSYQLALYSNCSLYTNWFPGRAAPAECDEVTLCSRSSDSLSAESCAIEETPCVCASEVCTDGDDYCYVTGCDTSESDERCGFPADS